MTDANMQDRLKRMIVERLFMKVTPEDIDPEKSLIDEYGVDSVSLLELIVGIEEEFGVVIEDEEFSVSNFETVSALEAFIKTKM